MGAEEYISKPFDLDDLKQLVNELVRELAGACIDNSNERTNLRAGHPFRGRHGDSLAGPHKKEFTDQFGVCVWNEHIKAVDEMWEGIQQALMASWMSNTRRSRIYQDGLPLCGGEMDIVRDVAAQGSQNHRLVLSLVQRGAFLEGTEDVQLLLEEYSYIQAITREREPGEKHRKAKSLGDKRKLLLRQRDQFIAQRIDKTLKEGETGILFAGMAHQVDKYLPKDINISYLIFRLPFSKLRPQGISSQKSSSPRAEEIVADQAERLELG